MRRFFIAAVLAATAAVPALGISRPSGSIRVAGAVLAERAGRVTATDITLETPLGAVSGTGYSTADALGDSGLAIVFPSNADGTYGVQRGAASVAFSVRGAASSSLEVSKGKVAYREIFPGVDAVHQLNGNRSEEFLVLKDQRAATEFTYDLDIASGVDFACLLSGGVRLSAANESGDTLVIEAPYVVDATGRISNDAARYEIDRDVPGQATIRLKVDTTGLAFPIAVDPTWSATATMSTTRSFPSATLLSNGRVLVAGGETVATAKATCEIYNPTNATWAATGTLNAARYQHAAVRLANGDVLAIGGKTTNGTLIRSVERWSVTTKTWSYTGYLSVVREGLTATVLTDGRVLVVGGDTATCEIYDPATGVWSATGSLAQKRRNHTAVRLNDGRVLVAGGDWTNSAFYLLSTGTVEIFNPASGTWSAANPCSSRTAHVGVLLADGRVFIAGGVYYYPGSNDGYLLTAQIFDPSTGVWTTTAPMTEGRLSMSATLLTNGRVLLVGGRRYDYSASGLSQAFDPATGTWKEPDTGGLVTPRYGHVAVRLSTGAVLVAGGTGSAGDLSSAEIR